RSLLFDQILAEWRRRCKLFGGRLDIKALAREIIGDRPAQAGVGNKMRRVGGVRHVASRQLVLAPGASFDPLEVIRNRVFDRLVVAELEMEERMVLDRSPISAVKRLATDEIDSPGNPTPCAARRHKQDAIADLVANDGKKIAREIGPPPFARTGFHIESKEGIPDRFG